MLAIKILILISAKASRKVFLTSFTVCTDQLLKANGSWYSTNGDSAFIWITRCANKGFEAVYL
ncbi:hypothetical protein CGBL_0105440 [Corynebacterium glutamicum]|nr:hypothetical protein CGBL_0105440 [Corynebacterium glutamicum]